MPKSYLCELEYLESTGTQYIDTGINGYNLITLDIGLMKLTSLSNECACGCWNDTLTRCWLAYFFGGNFYAGYGPFAGSMRTVSLNEWHTIKTEISERKYNYIVDGTKHEYNVNTFNSNQNIYMFAMNDKGRAFYYSKVRISYAKIYDNGVLVRDFIPVLDNSSCPCMYDRVSETCFYNQGTGVFKAAPYTANKSNKKLMHKKLALMLAGLKKSRPYYCEVEYLESDGRGQFINTGLLSTAQSKVDVVFGYNADESTSADNYSVFGGRDTHLKTTFTFFKIGSTNPHGFRFDYNGQVYVANAKSMTFNTDSKYRFQYTGLKSITTNISTGQMVEKTILPATTFTSYPISIFAVNTLGTHSLFLNGKIYKYKYTDGDITIDLIPVLDWDMVPCMYDKVSGKLFYNNGRGQFTYGRKIHRVEYLETTNNTNWFSLLYKPTKSTNFETKIRLNKDLNCWAIGSVFWWGINHVPKNPTLRICNNVYDAQTAASIPYTYGEDITLKLDGTKAYADGVEFGSVERKDATSTLDIFRYYNSPHLYFDGRIYYFDLWDDTGDVYKLRPMVDLDSGSGCMLDDVTHTIIDNSGTGVFKHPDVLLEYLESDGTQYIDTGVKPDDTYGYKVDLMQTALSNLEHNDQCPIGAMTATSRFVGTYFGNMSTETTNRVSCGWGSISKYVSITKGYSLNERVLSYCNYKNDRKIIFNDELIEDITKIPFTPNNVNLTLFNRNYVNTTGYFMGRIYSAEVTQGNDVIHKYTPIIRDGVAGMLDTITGDFLTNAGTGNFKMKIKEI